MFYFHFISTSDINKSDFGRNSVKKSMEELQLMLSIWTKLSKLGEKQKKLIICLSEIVRNVALFNVRNVNF